MTISMRRTFVRVLLATTALGALTAAAHADDAMDVETVIVTSSRESTHSAVELSGLQAQKILPGISPLKAIETLPGVVYETADPWGNNEQNLSLVVHGFTTQQLGFTMDGVPLGDQQYGNYNGLSPSRALTSENVRRVSLSSGTGSLGVASTSNLGGAIETFSSDPLDHFGVDARETGGSYDTSRTFIRFDSGNIGDGWMGYLSYLHQNQRAWDFDGYQHGDQLNLKLVKQTDTGKFTFYADWDSKVEPNEDATAFGNQQTAGAAGFIPYTRPFQYPNLAAAIASLQTNPAQPGTPPVAQGNNFSNYHSAAQREDALTYVQYDLTVSPDIKFSNQLYYHHDTGRGVVAGPINNAGLPALFAIYFPQLVVGGSATSTGSLTNIINQFGGLGYEARTTEYRINRWGYRSTLNWTLGDNEIEAGLWYERNASRTGRRWYPFSAANNDTTPYDVPRNPAFTQYDVAMKTNVLQLHLQDQWHITPDLTLSAGVKSSLQTAGNDVIVQQQNLQAGNVAGLPATSPQVQFPTGSIKSDDWFLPQAGLTWNATDSEQVFVNVQENMRQYIPYAAGSNFYGASPWSLGSQQAFDTFKNTAHPERSWTYEAGVRSSRQIDTDFLTGIDGQINYYHVDFSNRLFNVATFNFINPNPAILVNVGGVTADGVDVAATFHFGDHFAFYDAVSWNQSQYNDNILPNATINTTLLIAGKQVPVVPNWLNKFILSTNWGGFEAQVNGDFIGRRFATYTDDIKVGSSFLTGLEASYTFDDVDYLKKLKISGNITNLADIRGVSTINVTGASGGFQGFPIPPRMFFVTVSGSL
ncbi:MAG: TonB-dependent receptor [Alphaproteobacteria bacterium]|nr:TonB-dependent receptor [Alphaproteobacteria bacterium]MDB5739979.1 TonB-dependent receptor [Alphaproteobacteria bacterium]